MLEQELATVTSRMERTKRMVRAGTEDEDKATLSSSKTSGASRRSGPSFAQQGSVMALPPT
jgi:hypothetical protein